MIAAGLQPALAALDGRLDPQATAPVVVGLSGGSDSLALLLCARHWAARMGRRVLALTVDHELHPRSTTWTAEAGAVARRLGADWRGLSWRGAKPTSGLPAAARQARHALLAQATREAGGCVLLLGHTADDVRESDLIRRETPGHGHLQAWAPSPAWPQGRGVFLLRPLLALRRQALRAWLTTQGLGWLEDPANADPRFARARARAALAHEDARADGPPQTHDPDQAPHALAFQERWGALEIDPADLLAAPRPAAVLAKALLCASGSSRPPPRPALQRLLASVADEPPFTATLGGARLEARGGRLHLSRDLGRRPPASAPLVRGRAQVFDGRFELVASTPGYRVASAAGLLAQLSRAERAALHSLPPAARTGVPILLDEAARPRLPHPLGEGPASARSLVAARLAAALGATESESAAIQASEAMKAHGEDAHPVLSCLAGEQMIAPGGGGAPPGGPCRREPA